MHHFRPLEPLILLWLLGHGPVGSVSREPRVSNETRTAWTGNYLKWTCVNINTCIYRCFYMCGIRTESHSMQEARSEEDNKIKRGLGPSFQGQVDETLWGASNSHSDLCWTTFCESPNGISACLASVIATSMFRPLDLGFKPNSKSCLLRILGRLKHTIPTHPSDSPIMLRRDFLECFALEVCVDIANVTANSCGSVSAGLQSVAVKNGRTGV